MRIKINPKKIISILLIMFLTSPIMAETLTYSTIGDVSITNWNFMGDYYDDWTEELNENPINRFGNEYHYMSCTEGWETSSYDNAYGEYYNTTLSQNIGTQNAGIYTISSKYGIKDMNYGIWTIKLYNGDELIFEDITNNGEFSDGSGCDVHNFEEEQEMEEFDTIEITLSAKSSLADQYIGIERINITGNITTAYTITIENPTGIQTKNPLLSVYSNITHESLNYTINTTGAYYTGLENYYIGTDGDNHVYNKYLYGLNSGEHEITIISKGGNTTGTFNLDILDAPTNVNLSETNNYEKIRCSFNPNDFEEDFDERYFRIALFNTSNLDDSHYSYIIEDYNLNSKIVDGEQVYYYDFILGEEAYSEGTWMCSVVETQYNFYDGISKSSGVGYSDYYYRRGMYLDYYLDGELNGHELGNVWYDDVQVNFSSGYDYDEVTLISLNDKREQIEGKGVSLVNGIFSNENIRVDYPLSYLYVLSPYGDIIMGRSVPLFMSNDFIDDFWLYNSSYEQIDETTYHEFEEEYYYKILLNQQGTINYRMIISNDTSSWTYYSPLHLEDMSMMNNSEYVFYVNNGVCLREFLYNFDSDYEGLINRVMDYNKNQACNIETINTEGCCFIIPQEYNITMEVWSDITRTDSIGDNYIEYCEINQELADEGFIGDNEEDLIDKDCNIEGCCYNAFPVPIIFKNPITGKGGYELYFVRDLSWVWCNIWSIIIEYGWIILLLLSLMALKNIKGLI